MQKLLLVLVTLIFGFVLAGCSEPKPKKRTPGPHYKAYMVTSKHPVTSKQIRAAMAPLGKANIRQLDARTYLVSFYHPQALADLRARSTKRLKLFIHPDYGKSSVAKKQISRSGEQAAKEFLISTNTALTERQIKLIFRLQGKVVVRKIQENTYLIQFQQRVELKNLERSIRGTDIKQIQPNFKYRATGI